jgi:hypothetical protein
MDIQYKANETLEAKIRERILELKKLTMFMAIKWLTVRRTWWSELVRTMIMGNGRNQVVIYLMTTRVAANL